jgi:hypothetical protein
MGRPPIVWRPDTPAGARKRTRAAAPPPKTGWTLPPKVRQYLPYVVVFLAILTPLLHNPPRNNEVPPYLIGVWRSSTPGYEDRYLQFAQRNVIFGTGGIEGESYLVAEVQSSPAEEGAKDEAAKSKRMLFTIRYMKTDKLEYDLTFYYDPPPAEVITFKHQEKLTWRKKGSDT